ncbi:MULTISPECIES: cysteine hydrolase family protein [Niastella]|uniref:Cysteine hydrolase n=1 Tax=Niastella soli TaxID=2821487 RepID=A0ABS3Z2F5_9BACT|nr:isochorismatase family cysteine hydrolase [Niastella soli]MBO9203937.1 cysteine hydrolase [Niastella soli]
MKQQTALLVMDMQLGILQNLPNTNKVLETIKEAITKARTNNIPVIYVTLTFRPGFPEINLNNKGFHNFKERIANIPMETYSVIHPALAPKENDIVVHKKRVSAFTGSDLEVVLRSQGINHLTLTGVATGGVVLSTLREAADKDYALTVLADGCADADEEVHRVLTTKVFLRQATVVSVNEWMPQ